MKKKGFATSAVLYTMLLLFLVLMVSILNNLQNKKTILDQLKAETITALDQDETIDYLLDQIGLLRNQVTTLQEENEILKNNITTVEQNLGTKWGTYYMQSTLSEITDCNRLPNFSVGYTYPATPNSPGPGYIIATIGLDNVYKFQIAVNSVSSLKVRALFNTNGWSAWVEK